MLAPLILQSERPVTPAGVTTAGGPELGMLVWLLKQLPPRKGKKRKQQRPPKLRLLTWSMNDLSSAMDAIAAAHKFTL